MQRILMAFVDEVELKSPDTYVLKPRGIGSHLT